jgi:predicted membrane channel-forming protein YqfA (hemolysin III family)
MNTKKLAAVAIMFLIILFPFRMAYLDTAENSGILSIIMFLITLFGIFFCMYLFGSGDKEKSH